MYKKEIDKAFAEKYEDLVNVVELYLMKYKRKNNEEYVGELLSQLYLDLLKTDTPKFKLVIEQGRIYNYIYSAIKFQIINPTSTINKIYYPVKLKFEEEMVDYVSEETDLGEIHKFNYILDILHKIYFDGKINYYQHRIFLLYYSYEEVFSVIDGEDFENIKKNRKMTFDRLEELTKIKRNSLFSTIKKIRDLIREEVEKNKNLKKTY